MRSPRVIIQRTPDGDAKLPVHNDHYDPPFRSEKSPCPALFLELLYLTCEKPEPLNFKMQITSPTTLKVAITQLSPHHFLLPRPPRPLSPFLGPISTPGFTPKSRPPPSPRQRMSSFLSNWTSLGLFGECVARSLAPFLPRGGFSLVYVCGYIRTVSPLEASDGGASCRRSGTFPPAPIETDARHI